MTQKKLLTIGYQGRDVGGLAEQLKSHSIELLLDVRLRPRSRKKGFSKGALADLCAEIGIRYIHDADLGTPPAMLEHAKSGGGYDHDLRTEYRHYLLEDQSDALLRATELSMKSRVCLICYEATASDCHRSIVAEEIAKKSSVSVCHI